MDVFVCQKNKVHDVVKATGAKHVLSLLDPDDRLYLTPRLQEVNRLHLECEDVLDEKVWAAPTREQVQSFLEWARCIPDEDTLVVHCFAGVSRSTAAAIAILADRLGNVDAAGQRIKSVRPQPCPNPVIIKFADEILGLDGKLYEECEKVANYRLLTYLACGEEGDDDE